MSDIPQIFYIKTIIELINSFIIYDNYLLDCNKYLKNLKLKHYYFSKKKIHK